MVGYLDQAAEMHLAADVRLPRLVGGPPEIGQPCLVRLAEPVQNLVVGHAAKGLEVTGHLAIYYTGCGSNAEPEQVLAALEIKSLGAFGKDSVEKIRRDFNGCMTRHSLCLCHS